MVNNFAISTASAIKKNLLALKTAMNETFTYLHRYVNGVYLDVLVRAINLNYRIPIFQRIGP